MNENTNPKPQYFKFWEELFFDPEKAQVIEAFINGRDPYLPSDPELRRRYIGAARRVLSAPEGERQKLERIVKQVRAHSYTDHDYSEADLAANPASMTKLSEASERSA